MLRKPGWDEDSPQLRHNLRQVLREINARARQRGRPELEDARHWHRTTMKGLQADDPGYVGAFRGEPGLEDLWVVVGPREGADPSKVAMELSAFEQQLQTVVARLDRMIRPGADLDAAQLAEVMELCAWAHAEWVRVHPFANGNGRIARLWANSIAMRYGLPPFVRLRPRPRDEYAHASAQAMLGIWQPTVRVFNRLLQQHLAEVDEL
jgi:Fic family protein